MQLVLVADGCGAALEIAHVSAFVGDDQGALELAGLRSVDAEVSRQLHGAAHAFGHVDKRSVGEDGGVERRVEVIGMRNHRAEVLLDQIGMLLHRLRERAEDDTHLRELALEGGGHGDRVENRVNGHAREQLLLVEGDAELLVRAQNLRVNLVEAVELRLLLRGRVVGDVLVVDGSDGQVGPRWRSFFFRHAEPVAQRVQAPLQHELGLALARRDEANDVFVEPLGDTVLVDVGDEAPLVILLSETANRINS